jgi:hypothetical protein
MMLAWCWCLVEVCGMLMFGLGASCLLLLVDAWRWYLVLVLDAS